MRMMSRGSVARRVSFWLAAAASLLMTHDGIYLSELGAGRQLVEALRTAGHGYWPLASAVLFGCGLAVAIVWAVRLAWLARTAHGTPAPVPADLRPRTRWLARALRMWPRLVVVVLGAFLLQENVEHAVSHSHFLGLDALIGPEHPLALPVLVVVTALAALIAAAVRLHEQVLLSRIAGARLARTRASHTIGSIRPRRGRIARRHPLARLGAGRAPPALFLPS